MSLSFYLVTFLKHLGQSGIISCFISLEKVRCSKLPYSGGNKCKLMMLLPDGFNKKADF